MTDELDEDIDQEETDYDGTDAEVPLVIHQAPRQPYAHAARKREKTFEDRIGRVFHWLRDNVPTIITSYAFWTVLATLVIAYANVRYTQYAKKQWKEMHDANKTASDSLKLTQQELELSERPWVDVDLNLNGPLTYNVNGANIPVSVSIRNTGHSPALSVYVSPTPLTGGQGTADSVIRRDQLCEDAMKVVLKNPWFGNDIFPNGPPFVQPIDVGVGKDELSAHSTRREFPGSAFPPDTILGFSIVFCIAYRPGFDETSAYYTSYVMDLHKVPEQGQSPLFKIGEPVDRRHLLLQFHPFGAIKVGATRKPEGAYPR